MKSKENWKEGGRFIVMKYVLTQTPIVGSCMVLNIIFQLSFFTRKREDALLMF